MKQTMKMMITAMVAIAMVFSAFVIVLPGESQASSVDDQGTIMFNVIGTDGYFINGATWILKTTEGATVATGLTSNGGLGQTGLVPLDNYVLLVNKSGQSNTTNINYDPNTGFTFNVVTLGIDSLQTGIMGYLSALVSGTTVQVFDHDYNQQTVVLTGNSFHADVADGDYVVLIRVPGYLSVMANVTYSDATGIDDLENLTEVSFAKADGNDFALVADLDARETKMNRVVTVNFGADYNTFSYDREDNNTFESSQGALSNPELPIRMQIDNMGNGDGFVDSGEVTAFENAIRALGFMPVTNNFLKVNNVAYYQLAAQYDVSLSGLIGSVYETGNYQIVRTNEYQASSSIAVDAESYSSSLTVTYDTADINWSYIIDLPDEYELNSQVSKTQFVNIESTDYNIFTVHPMVRSGHTSEIVSMTYSMAGVPTASGVVDSSDYAYAVNVNNVLQHYIVGKDRQVTFNASTSVDPNGNPLANYVWDFGDGNQQNVTTATVQHTYATANSSGYNVTLKVINHNGNQSEQVSFKVLVDGKNPNAAIIMVTENPSAGSSVSFSGMNSTDDIAATDDKLGIIAKWIWNFGDGTANVTKTSDNGNVTKTFTTNGTYNVTLTVVDVAGNSNTTTQEVTVQRSEMPSLSIQSVTFSPEIFEEGSAGTITVVIKNTGNWEASSYTVNLYKVVGTETEFLTSEFFNTPLAPGENVTVNISYTFGAQGDYRLKITVEDDDPRTSDSNDYSSLTVSEAGWKSIAIFVGVIVVVGVIVALVYYRNRLPGKNAFKKGGAPMKQEKTLPKMDESFSAEESKKKAPSSGSGKSKKR